MENLSYANTIEKLRAKFGFDHCFSVDRVGKSGVLLFCGRIVFPVRLLVILEIILMLIFLRMVLYLGDYLVSTAIQNVKGEENRGT